MNTAPIYDIGIIGSGFGASLMAMIARRIGLSALLLERGSHPRFAIGESTSPLANLVLEQLAQRYDLPRLRPLCAFGPWQRAYTELGCGLKRGFTYFHHAANQRYQTTADRGNQLMVAASPRNEVADTHWLRADVDEFFLREAVATGAEYHDRVSLETPQWEEKSGLTALTGTAAGEPFAARARLVVDASGPRGFLSRSLGLPESEFCDYPPTQALYTHFTGVRRCDAMPEYAAAEAPPYPLDDAALHHVFPGGWMWVLRFGNGVTSAGIAVTDAYAADLGLTDGAATWERFLKCYPTIGAQFADAKAIRPFVHAPRLAFRAATAAGPGWVMLPSAAAFVDPLFSTGIPLTLLGVERLAGILETAWATEELPARLHAYSEATLAEADAAADFLSACYAAMPNFPVFADLSMFYFAAASYSEMARRLGTPDLAGGFLAAGHRTFGPGMRRVTALVRDCRGDVPLPEFAARVAEATDCLNIAGLCDPRKRNWYGVDLGDVVRGAAKLGRTPEAMRGILREADWAQSLPGVETSGESLPGVETPGYS